MKAEDFKEAVEKYLKAKDEKLRAEELQTVFALIPAPKQANQYAAPILYQYFLYQKDGYDQLKDEVQKQAKIAGCSLEKAEIDLRRLVPEYTWFRYAHIGIIWWFDNNRSCHHYITRPWLDQMPTPEQIKKEVTGDEW